MTQITFIDAHNTARTVVAECGKSLMENALSHDVPGIDADCGGGCSCATCHVVIDAAWAERVGAAAEAEAMMLEFIDGVQPTSRLSCQIIVSDRMDGLVVFTPASQG